MGFYILNTAIRLHDLLPKPCVAPQINSPLVQTSITLKAVQTPPSPRLPLPGALQALSISSDLPPCPPGSGSGGQP